MIKQEVKKFNQHGFHVGGKIVHQRYVIRATMAPDRPPRKLTVPETLEKEGVSSINLVFSMLLYLNHILDPLIGASETRGHGTIVMLISLGTRRNDWRCVLFWVVYGWDCLFLMILRPKSLRQKLKVILGCALCEYSCHHDVIRS